MNKRLSQPIIRIDQEEGKNFTAIPEDIKRSQRVGRGDVAAGTVHGDALGARRRVPS